MENFEHTRKNLGLTNSKSKDKDILNTYLPINNESVIEILKIQNKELRNDVSILKRLVYMLNVELELCDTRLKDHKTEKLYDIESRDNILKRTDIKMIEPLLRAFEQTKEEKDELLDNYKQSFDEFSKRYKQIVLENDYLRQQLMETKNKYECTYVEWKKLHEKFLLLEDHNQLLTRQTKLFQNKIRDIESVYRNNLKQCEHNEKELYEKLDSMRTEFLFLKGKFSGISEMKIQSVEKKDHQQELNLYGSVLSELKKLSTELKNQHTNEIKTLKNRIKLLESEKYDADISLAKITSERDHLQGFVSAMEMETKKKTTNVKD